MTAGVPQLMQKFNKGLSFIGVKEALGTLTLKHDSNPWKQGCSAESPRKPRKCSEIAHKESRDSE